MSHFFIDYDKEKRPLSWYEIMNNLLNSQAKYHNTLIGKMKKSSVEFDVNDFYEARRLQ